MVHRTGRSAAASALVLGLALCAALGPAWAAEPVSFEAALDRAVAEGVELPVVPELCKVSEKLHKTWFCPEPSPPSPTPSPSPTPAPKPPAPKPAPKPASHHKKPLGVIIAVPVAFMVAALAGLLLQAAQKKGTEEEPLVTDTSRRV